MRCEVRSVSGGPGQWRKRDGGVWTVQTSLAVVKCPVFLVSITEADAAQCSLSAGVNTSLIVCALARSSSADLPQPDRVPGLRHARSRHRHSHPHAVLGDERVTWSFFRPLLDFFLWMHLSRFLRLALQHPLQYRRCDHTRESGRLLSTLAASIWSQARGTRSIRRSRVAALSQCVESVGLGGFGTIIGNFLQERSGVGRAFKRVILDVCRSTEVVCFVKPTMSFLAEEIFRDEHRLRRSRRRSSWWWLRLLNWKRHVQVGPVLAHSRPVPRNWLDCCCSRALTPATLSGATASALQCLSDR